MPLAKPGRGVVHERGSAANRGSIGLVAFGTDETQTYIVSCSHVLAPWQVAPRFKDKLLDDSGEPIAELMEWTSLSTNARNPIDVAIAKILPGVTVDPALDVIGPPNGTSHNTPIGAAVFLRGADDTALTTGVISDPDASILAASGSRKVLYDRMVACSNFTAGGDSGSAVLNRHGRVVGIHVAGSSASSYFCRIKPAFDFLASSLGFRPRIPSRPEVSDLMNLGFNARAQPTTPSTTYTPSVTAVAVNKPVGIIGSGNVVDDAIDTMARTLWGEARGDWKTLGIDSYLAVAEVIMNRARRSSGGAQPTPDEVIAVCRKPCQFSCWNDGSSSSCPNPDPNLKLLRSVDRRDAAFVAALTISTDALKSNVRTDLTKGSMHYFNPRIAAPRWASGKRPVVTIGGHAFYNDID